MVPSAQKISNVVIDEPVTLTLYDANGALLKTMKVAAGQKYVPVDVSAITKGAYMITIITNKGIRLLKFVKSVN